MARIEPRDIAFEEFLESPLASEGMQVLTGDPTPSTSTALLNIPYAEKSGRSLHLQVILPPLPESARNDRELRLPTVLFVQGSAFHEQQLGQSLPALSDFAKRGYVVAIVEYRPSELAPFPAQAKDARTAVRWLREHAADFHVDVERIALWGDSSGGHTTLMVYATGGAPEFSDEPISDAEDPDLGLRCFIDFYGPTDISKMNDEPSVQDHTGPDSPEGWLIGRRNVAENADLVRPTVIMEHIPHAQHRALRPLLIMHGAKDRLVPFGQSVMLHEDVRAKGQPVTFYRLDGTDHGGSAFWTVEVLDIVDGFLRESFSG